MGSLSRVVNRSSGSDCIHIQIFAVNDCFVETCLATDRFGAPIPNSSSWSSPVAAILEFEATMLTARYGSECQVWSEQFG
jgi:hypothetical protein